MARPHLLTQERHESIVADIANSIPYEYAAEANGISERTLYNWLERGDNDRESELDTAFSRLLHDIKKAERNRIKSHIDNISSGHDKWTCDAWILERRWWKHYGKNSALIEFKKELDEMKRIMEKNDG